MLRRNIEGEEITSCFPFRNITNALNTSNSTLSSDSPQISIGSCVSSVSNNSSLKQKTQLCRRFTQDGRCPYANRCKFAHGPKQLRRQSEQNSRYKTKPCGAFLREGCCMYGDRCNFIHKVSYKLSKTIPEVELLMLKSQTAHRSKLLFLLQ